MAIGDNKQTIDSLPMRVSEDYETRRAASEGQLDDVSVVRASVVKDILVPTGTSAIDELMYGDVDTTPKGFTPPDLTNYQTRRAYSEGRMAPNFGPQDRLDSINVRIEGIKNSEISKLSKASKVPRSTLANVTPPGTTPPTPAASEEVISAITEEAKVLTYLVDTVSDINQTIAYVRTEITRFQKG